MLTVAVHRPDGGDSDRGGLGGMESTNRRLQEPKIERSTFIQSQFYQSYTYMYLFHVNFNMHVLNLNVLNLMLVPPHLMESSDSVLHSPFYHYRIVTSNSGRKRKT